MANCTLIARSARSNSEITRSRRRKILPTWTFTLERVTGIEPALSAWEADVLPLNYTRAREHGFVTFAIGRACAVFAQTSYRNR